MDDDGLLLNFTTASPSALNTKSTKPKAQGSWRERREASRSAPIRANSSTTDARKFPPKSASAGVHKPTAPRRSTKQTAKDNSFSSSASAVPKSGIVSSLFTYNPSSPSVAASSSASSSKSTNAPLNSTNFDINPSLNDFLAAKMGLSTPTRIQSVALPALKTGLQTQTDAVLVAQTGSGKTLAYLLPIFDELMQSSSKITRTSGIFALILAPTRELATQIYSVCEQLCQACHYIVPGLVIGGEKKKSEKARLRKGVNILVGTPGRLADHVAHTARLTFQHTRYVVLDEGDRLVDLGFEETLERILAAVPKARTTVLCSATMNAQTSRLKTVALRDPIEWVREPLPTETGSVDSANSANLANELTPGQLVQRIAIVPAKLRLTTLAAKLSDLNKRSQRAIVFFSGTDSVDFHFRVFNTTQLVPVFKLHGGMNQQQRQQTMAQFDKSEQGAVLLTTDVASRGLDISVHEVVEFDPPFTIEDHLHRVGRTARAGKRGDALMFLLPSEQAYVPKLESVHPGGLKVDSYRTLLQRGFGFSDWQDLATAYQLKIEKMVLEDTYELSDLAKQAFTSHVRAYTTHPHNEKPIFNFRDLHLGHLAKAFALRETPSAISGSNVKSVKTKPKSARQAMLDAAQRQLEQGDYNIA